MTSCSLILIVIELMGEENRHDVAEAGVASKIKEFAADTCSSMHANMICAAVDDCSDPFSDINPIPEGKALSFTPKGLCGRARRSVIQLPHGPVETPVFMAVGTHGTIKGLTPEEVRLSDSFVHLYSFRWEG